MHRQLWHMGNDHTEWRGTMRFTEQDSAFDLSKLNQCIESTKNHGEISEDDAETLTFFLELVKEMIVEKVMINS